MAKSFFDVFPTLDVPAEIHQLLGEVEVEKVSTNQAKDVYRIYLFSARLIPKKYIFQLERDIRQQIFRGKDLKIKIRIGNLLLGLAMKQMEYTIWMMFIILI